jgi:actin-like ATPase involved in cell morphogenesis
VQRGESSRVAGEEDPVDGTLAGPDDVLPRHVGEALGPFLACIADEVRGVISRSPEEAAAGLLEDGLTLAGAPALTPGLAEALAADLELPASVAPDPANLRVKGIALLLEERELLGEIAVEA